jgi:hypothetical protein
VKIRFAFHHHLTGRESVIDVPVASPPISSFVP